MGAGHRQPRVRHGVPMYPAAVPVRRGRRAAGVLVFAYMSVGFICFSLGTGSGLQFYFLVAASLVVLVLGIERIVKASVIAAIGVAITIALELFVPNDRGLGPQWTLTVGFVTLGGVFGGDDRGDDLVHVARDRPGRSRRWKPSTSDPSGCWPTSCPRRSPSGSRIRRARSSPTSTTKRPILFADIAGYTQAGQRHPPADLVRFLDRLYTDLDALVDRHGLEKVKTSGDSYMVVSGVPIPRDDHIEALACLALDMAEAVADLKDPQGRTVPLRIGMAAGPVVAGVVGAKKFFYDIWGDAVNVASRMETHRRRGPNSGARQRL